MNFDGDLWSDTSDSVYLYLAASLTGETEQTMAEADTDSESRSAESDPKLWGKGENLIAIETAGNDTEVRHVHMPKVNTVVCPSDGESSYPSELDVLISLAHLQKLERKTFKTIDNTSPPPSSGKGWQA